MAVRPDRLDALVPIHAGWWAAENPLGDYYGPPLGSRSRRAGWTPRPRGSRGWERRPLSSCWSGSAIERIHEHDLELANRFRAGMGLEPGDSAIVSVDVEDGAERLERAGIRAAVRAGGLRVSFHLYNTPADVDAALDALALADLDRALRLVGRVLRLLASDRDSPSTALSAPAGRRERRRKASRRRPASAPAEARPLPPLRCCCARPVRGASERPAEYLNHLAVEGDGHMAGAGDVQTSSAAASIPTSHDRNRPPAAVGDISSSSGRNVERRIADPSSTAPRRRVALTQQRNMLRRKPVQVLAGLRAP